LQGRENPNQHQGGALRRTFMPLHEHLHHSLFSRAVFGKAALATAALSGFFLFAGAPSAKADSCQRRIAHAEHELGEAIEDHGYYSRQANHWRHERNEAYERCYGHGYYREDGSYRDERGNYYRYECDRDRYNDYDRRRHRDRDDD
jgi:hypothetical protein